MIELKIDGEVYTEKEFQRDLKRYLNTLDKGKATCNSYENCEKCMFFNHALCGIQYTRSTPINYSLKIIEKVYEWAKEHPVVTNRDKIKDVFGFNMTSWDDAKLNGKDFDFNKWLSSEYKEPNKDD